MTGRNTDQFCQSFFRLVALCYQLAGEIQFRLFDDP